METVIVKSSGDKSNDDKSNDVKSSGDKSNDVKSNSDKSNDDKSNSDKSNDVESSDDKTDSLVNQLIPLHSKLYREPYNVIRRAKVILFGYVLNKYDDFKKISYGDQTKLLIKIERSCFNYCIESANDNNVIPSWDIDLFKDIYTSICYKVSTNLDPDGLIKNKQLALDLLNDKISIKRLPKLTSLEMFPQKYVNIIERLEASKNIKNTIKTTSMYICKKCKENKCTIENLYNRSLDEGVNLKITCVNCGYEFNA